MKKIKKIKNLNEDIYSRFGLNLDVEKAQSGFLVFAKNSLLEILGPISNPDLYEGPTELREIQSNIIKEFSRATFRDKNSFYGSWNRPFERLLGNIFSSGSFENVIADLQILINLIFENYKWNEKDKFIDEIEKYLDDFPVIGLNIKRYKVKAPQFFPARNRFFDDQVISLLGKLENGDYKDALNYFEVGIKNFIKAKSKTDLKKVVDDMHASIDEFIKVFTNDNNKSFRSIFKSSDEYRKYGFKNKRQREMFKNLKDMMDAIKHGSNKDFDKDDIEVIINTTASLLSFLTEKKYKNKV